MTNDDKEIFLFLHLAPVATTRQGLKSLANSLSPLKRTETLLGVGFNRLGL